MAYRVVTVIKLVSHLVSLVEMPHSASELSVSEHGFATGSTWLRNVILEGLVLATLMVFGVRSKEAKSDVTVRPTHTHLSLHVFLIMHSDDLGLGTFLA